MPICVHSCAPMSVRNGATVYTNAPKRLREVIFANLCTLLCPHGRSRTGRGHESHDIDGPMALVMLAQVLGPDAYAAGAVTQPPTRTHEASLKTTVYGTAVRTLGWDGTRKEVVCTAPSGEGTSWRPSSGLIMATRTRYALISLQMLPNTLHSRKVSDAFPPQPTSRGAASATGSARGPGMGCASPADDVEAKARGRRPAGGCHAGAGA